jgi:EAL domain-containing protein (putative c-di-GMP-specific phosphodiesterase class I)
MDAQQFLIVDDSVSIRLALEAFLNSLNITNIDNCENGVKALELIQQAPEKYGLIFVDLNMPEMDGMTLIRHLGEAKFSGGVVIVSEMESRVVNLASEIAKNNHIHLIGNLQKPIVIEKLEVIIEKHNIFRQRRNTNFESLSEEELINAISEKRIIPHYQPKVDINNHQLHSVELLARIDSPEHGGIIPPFRFISAAEDYGLIDLLTFQMLEIAISEFREMQSIIKTPFTLALNLSPIQLEDLEIPDKIDSMISQFNVEPRQLVIEVTEDHALISNNQLETINRFRIKGYGVALDDFGTGFTNVNQLLNLPFSEVKIDRSLVTNIQNDRFSQVIVNSLVELGKTLDIDLVAEGIETMDELKYFEKFGSQIFLQGYIFTKPKPKCEFLRWYQSWEKTRQKCLNKNQ